MFNLSYKANVATKAIEADTLLIKMVLTASPKYGVVQYCLIHLLIFVYTV